MSDGRVPESADQKGLIVWCDDTEAAAPLVTALRQRFAVELSDSLSALAPRLEEPPAVGLVLLYLSPVETLCRAMAAQTPPSTALADWRSRAEDILALNRRDRRRVWLLEIGAGRGNPDVFRRHFYLPQAELSALPPQDLVLRLMANQAISGDPQARRIQGELEAASLDCSGGAKTAENPDSAFYTYQHMLQAQQKAEVLQAQAHLTQKELSALAAQKEALETSAATAEKGKQKAQKDVDLLKSQNRAVQEELEATSRRKLELESGLDAAQQDRQKAQQEVDLLRAQVRLMKQEMGTLSTDRERLEQRLAQMSQGLESHQAQIAALSAERDRLSRRVEEKERSIAAAAAGLRAAETQRDYLTTRLDDTLAERESARRDAQAKDAEIQKIMTSKSFRLTEPLRRIRSLFSNGSAA